MLRTNPSYAAMSGARPLPPRRPIVALSNAATAATKPRLSARRTAAGADGDARLDEEARHRYFECCYGSIGADLAMDFIGRINALPAREFLALPKELEGRPVIHVQRRRSTTAASPQPLSVLDAVNAGRFGWRLRIISDWGEGGVVIGFRPCQ